MIYEEKTKNQIRNYLINSNTIMFDTERRNICLIGKEFQICCFYIDRDFFIELLDVGYKLNIKIFILSERD